MNFSPKHSFHLCDSYCFQTFSAGSSECYPSALVGSLPQHCPLFLESSSVLTSGVAPGWEGGGASPCERSSHGLVSRTPHRALTSGDGHHQETDQGLPLCAQVLPTRGVPTPRFLCKSISADSPCGREKMGSSLVQVCAKPESPRVKQGAHVPLLSDL